MRFKDIDWWFIIMSSILAPLMLMDVALTYNGMLLGFSEGNPMFVYLFNLFGVKITLIITGLIFVAFYFLLIWIRHKMCKTENHIRSLYCVVGIGIGLRAFIVGTWLGMIATYINGGLF